MLMVIYIWLPISWCRIGWKIIFYTSAQQAEVCPKWFNVSFAVFEPEPFADHIKIADLVVVLWWLNVLKELIRQLRKKVTSRRFLLLLLLFSVIPFWLVSMKVDWVKCITKTSCMSLKSLHCYWWHFLFLKQEKHSILLEKENSVPLLTFMHWVCTVFANYYSRCHTDCSSIKIMLIVLNGKRGAV